MKRLIGLLMILAFAALPVLSQVLIPPDNVIEWVSRFPEMIGSPWGVYVSVVLLVPVLVGFLNVEGKGLKYVLTGVIGVTLIVLATFLSFGYLYGAPILLVILNWVLLMGAQVIGYVALKPMWDAIAEKFNPWKPAE